MATTVGKHYFFTLHISQQEYLRYYEGTADRVLVVSECGRKLSFPAHRLRPFLTYQGISGRFLLSVDVNNRFISLQQVVRRR